MNISRFWVRALGIFGIIGGLTLLAGDLLFYYDPVSTNLNINMGNSSDLRIMLSALTALFATWFYILGTGQVFYAFSPSSTIARNTVVISFAAIFIAYGVIHGAYVAIAVAAKISVSNNLDLLETVAFARETNDLLRLLVYPIFALLSVVFISQVWKRKTLYPRWIIIFFPLVLFPFKIVLNSILKNGSWIIFVAGFYNLILVIFFLASTISLWNASLENKNNI